MHAADRDRDKNAEAGHGRIPGRGPAAAGAGTPLHALHGLQGTAGNAAVVQFLRGSAGSPAREQHRHGAGCGHGTEQQPQVQRSAVHEVLRGGGRPLDDATRTDMEARLGADFSDVRIHTGGAAKASAADLGARAYTSGSHVVIGEGGGDKHTLAHELTHVIQQRKGPVAGTDHGNGLRVSDPSDRFEREAEANATRALSGSAPAGRAVQRAGAGAAPGPAGTVRTDGVPQVQRMEAIKKQISAAASIFGLRQDEVSPGAPRQKAAKHIRDELKARGLEGQDTVGSRVADAIDGIKTVAGEHGARDIHSVFTRAELAELYAIPSNDPRAKEAHERIAAMEYAYWTAQHQANPTRGTQIAVGVDVQTRVGLQQTVGGTTAYMRQFQEAFRKDMENR
ncbi:eCIS core domain-containing protein [Streptomyces vinaceus]|uniref:eCIS core domain-containing protein n=1 Tax=Streptomyces vinaceus TaxID=1960 RepID=UPI00369E8844